MCASDYEKKSNCKVKNIWGISNTIFTADIFFYIHTLLFILKKPAHSEGASIQWKWGIIGDLLKGGSKPSQMRAEFKAAGGAGSQ